MQNELTTYLDAFVASADEGSFSAAARRLAITPPAISKSVARLEAGLGVRLFLRSTRSLSLTEEGERLYQRVRLPWTEVIDALAELKQGAGKPAGTLKISMAPTVGRTYFVPLLDSFLERYPDIVPDVRFDNRQVDLIGEGFDVAIGGGVELAEGLIARELAQVKVILVASPDYLGRHGAPAEPGALSRHRGLLRRAIGSGRLIPWVLKHTDGGEVVANVRPVGVLDDPEALARAAACGLGIALLPVPHVLPMIRSGELVRVLPDWDADARPLSIYYSNRKLLPAKVRVFVDFIVNEVRNRGYRDIFAAD
jgi:DNA-binding transcriptional LysR family regulator